MKAISLVLLTITALFAVKNIHWGSDNTPIQGLTLSWNSEGDSDFLKWGYSASLENGIVTPEKSTTEMGIHYRYRFENVKPNQKLYYRIKDSKSGSWGETKEFQTANESDSITFTFGGDSRTNLDDYKRIAGKVPTLDFMLYLGDVVGDGRKTSDWHNWFSYGPGLTEKNCIYHTYGNHDKGEIYKSLFDLPGNEMYYSFQYGPALFISLNSEDFDSDTQKRWLVETLIRYETVSWKVIFFHKPFFAQGYHQGEMDSYLYSWWSIFDTYGVDLILGGHAHYYQRSKPINLAVSTTSAVDYYGDSDDGGRCMIVSGGMGAPLIPKAEENWNTHLSVSALHYGKVTADSTQMQITVIDVEGKVIDSFNLNKGSRNGALHLSPQKAGKTGVTITLNNQTLSVTGNSTSIRDIELYTVNGSMIMRSKPANQNGLILNLGNREVSKGMYLLKITNDNYSQVVKLLFI